MDASLPILDANIGKDDCPLMAAKTDEKKDDAAATRTENKTAACRGGPDHAHNNTIIQKHTVGEAPTKKDPGVKEQKSAVAISKNDVKSAKTQYAFPASRPGDDDELEAKMIHKSNPHLLGIVAQKDAPSPPPLLGESTTTGEIIRHPLHDDERSASDLIIEPICLSLDGIESLDHNVQLQPLPVPPRIATPSPSVPGDHFVPGVFFSAHSSDTDHEDEEEIVEEHQNNHSSHNQNGQQEPQHYQIPAVLVEDNEEVWTTSSRSIDPGTGADLMEQGEVIEATIMQPEEEQQPPPQPQQCGQRGYITLVLVILVIGLAAIVTTVMVVSSHHEDDDSTKDNNMEVMNDTQEATPTPSRNIYTPFLENLPVANEIADMNSPYYEANVWMWEDPNKDTYSPKQQMQRFYMVLLYHLTNGSNWTRNDHWLSYNVSECDWFSQSLGTDEEGGPICDNEENLLILNLTSNNLHGSLQESPYGVHSSIYGFQTLKILDVSHNSIHGGMPGWNSWDMEIFDVSHNTLDSFAVASGDVETLAKVRVLKMNNNQMRGDLLGAVFPYMPSIEIWNATNNRFSGIVAPTISSCKNLTHYGLGNNLNMMGNLPTELGVLTALKEFDVSGNMDIEGMVPTELGLLTQLTHLDLSGTRLSGDIPDPICSRVDNDVIDFFANCSLVGCCL